MFIVTVEHYNRLKANLTENGAFFSTHLTFKNFQPPPPEIVIKGHWTS